MRFRWFAVLATLAPFLVASPAFAQTSSSSTSWTGPYVGASLGGSSGTAKDQTTTVFDQAGYFAMTSPAAIASASATSVSSGAIVAGVRAGLNLQRGPLVYGFEIDYGVMRTNAGVTTTSVYPCCAPASFSITQRTKTNWLMTLRPRAGVVAGPLYVYGTIGWARTHLNHAVTFTDTFQNATESGAIDRIDNGIVIGGGVEIRPMRHWSLGAEYLRPDFGTSKATSTNLTAGMPPQAFPQNVFTHQVHLVENVVRVTLRLHF